MEVSIFNSILSTVFNRSPKAEQFTLPGGKQDPVSVRPMGQVVEVLSGAAWIASNGRDCELLSGQRYTLPVGGDAVLISALGNNVLVFRLHKVTD